VKYRSRKPEYAGAAPYEGSSKEAVADSIRERIKDWAAKSLGPYQGYDNARKILEVIIRDDFIKSLIEEE